MTRRPSISSPLFFVDRQLRSMHTAQWLIWLIRMWTNSRVVSGTPARLAASLATLLTACSASSAPGTLIAGLVIRGCIMLFSCHIDGVFRVTSVDTRARSDVTDGRARLAGPALRGRAGPPEGRGLPHAGIADRGGRRGPGRLAAPEPLRADGVDNLRAWLTTIVARVCLNMLRSRNVRREEPLDVHVPDPVITFDDSADPEQQALLADSVGLALQVVLGMLAPDERLAFVLHDMFDVPFAEIAPIVGCSPDAARQMASRARRRVRGAAPAPDADL